MKQRARNKIWRTGGCEIVKLMRMWKVNWLMLLIVVLLQEFTLHNKNNDKLMLVDASLSMIQAKHLIGSRSFTFSTGSEQQQQQQQNLEQPILLSHQSHNNLEPANNEKPFASMLNSAVINGKVSLPCDISTASPDDSVALILWYKDDSLAPIYTIDARKDRANFNSQSKPAQLELEFIRQEDEGEYRCRVDFRRGRTVNTIIALRVLVPPTELRIISPERPNSKLEGLIGPFNEGSSLTLICLVQGGKPRPQVSWRRDFNVIDDTYQHLDKDGTSNELRIQSLSKNHLLSIFTCLASNSNLTSPLQSSITLDLNLKPQEVSLRQLNSAEPLIVGQRATFECLTQGSRPQATIYWMFQGVRHDTPMNVDQQQTSARWTLVIQKSFNQEPLTCVAENPKIPNLSEIKHTIKLDVHYPPQLTIKLEPPLESPAQEGNDIYLFCHLDANPKPVKPIIWRFKGRPIQASSQFVMNNHSLVLRKVSRHQSGAYTCEASNLQGSSSSQPLDLLIRHAPVCASDDILVYEAGIGQTVYIDCGVLANPASSVHYSWFVASQNDVSSKNLTDWIQRDAALDEQIDESVPKLKLRSSSGNTLIKCKAKNEIGLQQRACLFQLTEAREPLLGHNCSLVSTRPTSAQIACQPLNLERGNNSTRGNAPYKNEEEEAHEQPGWQLGLGAASSAVSRASNFLTSADGFAHGEPRPRLVFPPAWYLIELFKQGDTKSETSLIEQPIARFIVGASNELPKIRTLVEENKLLAQYDSLEMTRSKEPPVYYLPARNVISIPETSSLKVSNQELEKLNRSQAFGFTVSNLETSHGYKLLIYSQNLAKRTSDWQMVQVETGVGSSESGGEQVASLIGANLVSSSSSSNQDSSSGGQFSVQKSIVMRSDSSVTEQQLATSRDSSTTTGQENNSKDRDRELQLVTGSSTGSSGGFFNRLGGAARLTERWQQQLSPYVDYALTYARQKPLLAVPALVSATLLVLLLVGWSGSRLVRLSRSRGSGRKGRRVGVEGDENHKLASLSYCSPELNAENTLHLSSIEQRAPSSVLSELNNQRDNSDLLKQKKQQDDETLDASGYESTVSLKKPPHSNLLASHQQQRHLTGSLDRRSGLYIETGGGSGDETSKPEQLQLQLSHLSGSSQFPLYGGGGSFAGSGHQVGSLDRASRNLCSSILQHNNNKLLNGIDQHQHQHQHQYHQYQHHHHHHHHQPHHQSHQHQHQHHHHQQQHQPHQFHQLAPATYLAEGDAERLLSELANSCSYNSGSFSSTECSSELHNNNSIAPFKGRSQPRVAFDLSHQQPSSGTAGGGGEGGARTKSIGCISSSAKQLIYQSVQKQQQQLLDLSVCNDNNASNNKGSDTSSSLNTAGDSGHESPATTTTIGPSLDQLQTQQQQLNSSSSNNNNWTSHHTCPASHFTLMAEQNKQLLAQTDDSPDSNYQSSNSGFGNQVFMLIAPQSNSSSPLLALDSPYESHEETLRYLRDNHQMATRFTSKQMNEKSNSVEHQQQQNQLYKQQKQQTSPTISCQIGKTVENWQL